jgi:UDP-N-acetylmuramoyl-tripeptide--D-alanyl-D-alanine ligase
MSSDIPIIAITGTSGKTTIKEMIASILKLKWNIYKSFQNGNNAWYLSNNLNQINDYHQALILEYGMCKEGDIKEQCEIIQPNISVISNVGLAHIGNMADQTNGVIKAKSELIKGMKKSGILYVNADDSNSKLLDINGFSGKIIKIGITNVADFNAEQIKYTDFGMEFIVRIKGESYVFRLPIYGEHNIYNALFAIAICYHLGFSKQLISEGLESFYQPYGRLNVHNYKDNITIIDDTFNTKPCSMKSSLEVLHKIGNNKKIAVLGSIRDLGVHFVPEHRKIGNNVARKSFNLFTVGEEAKAIFQGAIDGGLPSNKMKHFEDLDCLYRELISSLEPNTTILFNGSIRKENESRRLMHIAMDIKTYLETI